MKLWSAFLQLAVLSAMVIAQPLYDLLGSYPEFFIARKFTPGDILALVFFLSLLIPAVVTLGLWLLKSLSSVAYHWMLGVLLALAVAALVLQFADELLSSLTLKFLFAFCAFLSFLFVYLRRDFIGPLLLWMTPVVVLFPALFLLSSDVAAYLQRWNESAPTQTVEGATPVVLIIFDELPTTTLLTPELEIDAQLFPAFADLARHSSWYRNATSVAAGTLKAVPAILSGQNPSAVLMPSVTDYPNNIFTLFGESYEMQVVEPITELCPRIRCVNVPLSFAERMSAMLTDVKLVYWHLLWPAELAAKLPPIDEGWLNFDREEQLSIFGAVEKRHGEAENWEIVRELDARAKARKLDASLGDIGGEFLGALAAIRPESQKYLHVQHVSLPHVPWRFLPSGKEYKDLRVYGKQPGKGRWATGQPWLLVQAYQRHLLQTMYVDTLMGELLQHLRQTGQFDDVLLVITADHGASFREGAHRRTPQDDNIADLAGVPLFIKMPGQTVGKTSDRAARTTDILPTIVDALDIDIDWSFEGHSLLDHETPKRSRFSLLSPNGQKFELPLEQLNERNWVLDSLRAQFLPEGAGINPYAYGPQGKFIGTPLSQLAVRDDAQYFGGIRWKYALRHVDLSGDHVPALISGQVVAEDGEQVPSMPLLLAINGVIQGTGWTFSDDGKSGLFAIMVPEKALINGENAVSLLRWESDATTASVELYEIVEPGSQVAE